VKYAAEMASGGMIYIPSFMTIGLGIKVTLRLLLQQLESFSAAITDWKDLRNKTLKWPQVSGLCHFRKFIELCKIFRFCALV
jgi:hypothetical protein